MFKNAANQMVDMANGRPESPCLGEAPDDDGARKTPSRPLRRATQAEFPPAVRAGDEPHAQQRAEHRGDLRPGAAALAEADGERRGIERYGGIRGPASG
jgi:hypothetical protein